MADIRDAGRQVGGENAHDEQISSKPVLVGFEAKDFDGSALPNNVSAEADLVRAAASLYGVQYVMMVNEDGSAVGTINVNSHAVTNAGTFVVQENGNLLTSSQKIDAAVKVDDAAFTPAVTSVMMAGFEFDDSSPDSVNEGDAGAARMSANRNVYVNIRDAAGNERGLNIDANNEFQISGIRNAITVSSHNVTNAGTFAVQVNGDALSSLQLLDDVVFIDDLAFVAESSKGVAMMAAATSDSVGAGDIGIIGMLPNRQLKVSLYDSSGAELSVGGGTQYTEDAAAAANPVGNAIIVVRDDSRSGSLTTTDGDNVALRGTNSGELYVKHVDSIPITDNSGSLTIDAPVGTPVFVRLSDGSAAITTLAVSLATVPSHAVTNAGTFAVQVDGAALTALQLIDDSIFTDDAAFTPTSSKVSVAGFQADETATDSVDEGDAGAARMTLDRKQICTVQPHTKGGWSTFMATSGDSSTALTNSAQAVKASAGQLGGWYIFNPNSSTAYVVIWNLGTGSITVGTTAAKMILPVPAGSAANLEIVNGIEFDTAISVAATTTATGNTAPSTALEANFWYK